MGLIHDIIVMWSTLLRRIVKARSRCIWIGAIPSLYLPLILVVFALARDGPATVGELATSIWFVRLVEGVRMTISCWLSSSTYRRVVSTGYLRTKLAIIQVRNVAQSTNVLIIY